MRKKTGKKLACAALDAKRRCGKRGEITKGERARASGNEDKSREKTDARQDENERKREKGRSTLGPLFFWTRRGETGYSSFLRFSFFVGCSRTPALHTTSAPRHQLLPR